MYTKGSGFPVLYNYYDYFLSIKISAEVVLQLIEYKLFFVGLIGSIITLMYSIDFYTFSVPFEVADNSKRDLWPRRCR